MHQETTVQILRPSILPKNSFLEWLRQELREGHIAIDFSLHPHQFVSDMINSASIQSWNPDIPILISTQTGTGKNYFIRNILLRFLLESHRINSEGAALILVLSNRIALNRQNKENFAKAVQNVIGNTSPAEEIDKQLKEEGIDHKTNFGPVDIYSYHQFQKAHPLRKREYKFIICDECHFFTADAIFNPSTNEILRELVCDGSSAVRIYTSATPDVAFEAIIRLEYERFMDDIKALDEANQRFKNGFDAKAARISAFARHDAARLKFYSETNIDRRFKDELTSIYPFRIRFYYGERDYSYIHKIFTYEKIEDLADCIIASDEKWMIFVASESIGKNLMILLNQKKNSEEDDNNFCAFLSRSAVNSNKRAKEVYNHLINKEKFDEKVLISTSLLDNGINIDDAEVHNIVIDYFDRTAFIQMIGRKRVRKGEQITIYLHDYSMEELNELLKKREVTLLERLKNDLLTVEDRKEHFAPQKFFYTDNPNTFCSYNPCAIYQLVESMNRIMNLLNNHEIPFNHDSCSADHIKLYNYYKLNPDGREKTWSRNIVDLLESYEGERWRASEREKDMIGGEFSDRYDYHFHDSFTRFIFSDMIPHYYWSKIENIAKKEVNSKLSTLNDFQKNRFKIFLQHNTNAALGELSYYETLKNLSIFIETTHCGLSINLSLLNEYAEKASASKKFAERIAHSSIEEQLFWIEKPDAATISLDSLSTGTKDAQTLKEHENWIQEHALSKQDIESHRLKKENGSSAKYFECKFLEAYGVPKDSDSDFHLAQDVFHKNKLTECLHQTVTLNGCDYALESYTANTQKHPVFYLFVIAEKNPPQSNHCVA